MKTCFILAISRTMGTLMAFYEKDMEDLIWNDPDLFIGEKGLTRVERQVPLDGYRADVLFSDSKGSYLLIEIQRGSLDRTHIWKILDYGFRFKKQKNDKLIRLMVIANTISKRQVETLDHLNVEYRQIPESDFLKFGVSSPADEPVQKNKNGDVYEISKTSFEPFFDRGLDARYFGFSGTRAIAASLYARSKGATQQEVNTFVAEITPQKGFYNLLDQANKWGHSVATWDDENRGKVFKLIFNPEHKAQRATEPPKTWMDLNRCLSPENVKVSIWTRSSRGN